MKTPLATKINTQAIYATSNELDWLAQYGEGNTHAIVVMIGAGPGVMAIALLESGLRWMTIIDAKGFDSIGRSFEAVGININRNQYILSDSSKVKWFEHQPIDLLIVDGDHTYDGVRRDIDAWWPHVKIGGLIFFHDCKENLNQIPTGVKEAIDRIPIEKYEPVAEFDITKIIRRVA
jgi:hypothetical protein